MFPSISTHLLTSQPLHEINEETRFTARAIEANYGLWSRPLGALMVKHVMMVIS